jgi:signal transduction histidine kinase
MNYDYPTVRLFNGIPVFSSGTYCDLPLEYSKQSNVGKLTEFYSNLLASQEGLVYGTDPLGFDFIKKEFLCYTGLVCGFGLRSQFNRMRKKHPERVFRKEYILARIESEHSLKNFKEFIPIDAVTQNIHELRGLNGKISAHIDAIMGVKSESDWEDAFERASEPIKKIYVGSRLIKFILDNTRFFRPNFFADLVIDQSKSFRPHQSVSKIVKIYGHDFRKRKSEIQFTGSTYAQVKGEREYFEIVIKILVENALKYSADSEKMPPKIVISEVDGRVIVRVSSLGLLVPLTDASQVFTKGFRSETHKTLKEGTGMGLYNAFNIAKAFGGEIIYQPEEVNKGTNVGWNHFSVTVPVAKS